MVQKELEDIAEMARPLPLAFRLLRCNFLHQPLKTVRLYVVLLEWGTLRAS